MVAVEEFENVETVVVLARVTMLWRESVIDGDNNGGEFTSKATANGVVREGGSGEEGESTAVEEDENREEGSVCCGGWCVEAEPRVACGVYSDIGGDDAFEWFGSWA